MDKVEILLAILVWLLVVGAALLRVPGGGVRSLIAPWLALTALTLGVEFIVLFIATYGLLTLGEGAATVGVVVSVVILAATPVVWAVVLRRRARNAAAQSAAAQNDAPAHV
jgi:hypothetical protein